MTAKIHITDHPGAPAFAFSEANFSKAEAIIARYPAGRQQSAVMPLLMLAQRQNGNWLSRSAMDHVAGILGMPPVRVYEVATFYTMYNLAPVGRHMIEVCTTTPCWLRGSDAIVQACASHLGIGVGETTADGRFTLREAECLGACVNAPMCQIGDHYYEDLSPEAMISIINALAAGQAPRPGPQNGRVSSEPLGGAVTLKQVG